MCIHIPPVFNDVCQREWRLEKAEEYWKSHYPSYGAIFFRSGTEALGYVLDQALRSLRAGQNNVLVPAYGCPDIVAAVLYAGAHPVLVDILPDKWGYDFEDLDRKLRRSGGVVVAVDLFGLGAQYNEISVLANKYGIEVVLDSAQFVAPNGQFFDNARQIVWSFGRGKPVNLLGGGALLSKIDCWDEKLSMFKGESGIGRRYLGKWSGKLHNRIVRSRSYSVVSRFPLFGVGRTVYSSCKDAVILPGDFVCRLAPALEVRKSAVDNRVAMHLWELINGFATKGLCTQLLDKREGDLNKLLRFPFLARDKEERNILVKSLNHCGLGASIMYGASLPEVANMPLVAKRQGQFSGADLFAQRLLTLPIHELVTENHLDKIEEIFRDHYRK